MKFRFILIMLIVVFFLFPILSGVIWPQNFMPTEIGTFFHQLADYWLKLVKSAIGQ